MGADAPETCLQGLHKKGLLFGEQMSIMASKVCMSEDMLDMYDHGWGTAG